MDSDFIAAVLNSRRIIAARPARGSNANGSTRPRETRYPRFELSDEAFTVKGSREREREREREVGRQGRCETIDSR